MGKLGKLSKAIKILKSKPYLINQIVEHDSVYKDKIADEFGFANGFPSIPFKSIVTETELPNYLFLDGGSLITDLLLLKSLAKSIENCKYFEIGTWRGESCTTVVDHCERCLTFNLSLKDIQALGHDQVYTDQLELLSKANPRIEHIKGNSQTFDYSTLDCIPNLIFIDGDHHADAVKADTERIFEWVDPNECTIVWHDYGNSPEKVRWSVMHGILAGLPKEEHQYLYHVENTKCAIFTRKKYESRQLSWPNQPRLNFRPIIRPEELK